MRDTIARLMLMASLIVAYPRGARAADAEDLTPPDVKLAKLSFALNGLDYTLEAPEGATVKVAPFSAVVSDGKDFNFTINLGKRRFTSDRSSRVFGHSRIQQVTRWEKDAFLIESKTEDDKRFAASALVSVPYIDFTISSKRAELRANCLLILKCSQTLTLKSPPPAEPAAILEWLKADVRKDDDGKVQSLALPAFTTDAALLLLAKIPTLKSLTITFGSDASEGITDAGLVELDDLPNLEELGLISDRITGTQLAHVGRVPNLITLSLGPATGVGDIDETAMAELKGLAHLQTLDLTNVRVGDEALACLKDMRSLKVLRLGNTVAIDKREGPQRVKLCTITDEGLAHLAILKNLETLSLRRTDITGVGFKHLADCKKLQNLELNDTFLTDEGLEPIGEMVSLQLLQIARTNITGEGLKHLFNLEKLRKLDLTDTAVDDQALRHLEALTTLESLQLRRTRVTDAGMYQLETLKNLEVLNLSETKLTDAGLPHFYRLKKLQSLSTSDTAVTQDALDKLDRAREGQ